MARVLIHSLVFPPDATSNAYILADLARELKAHGHDLTVITTTPHYSAVEEYLDKQPLTPAKGSWLLKSDFEGIPCYHVRVPSVKGGFSSRLKTALRFHMSALRAARALGRKFDVVLSSSPPLSIGLVGSWIARRTGARAVYIVQDIFPDDLISRGKISNGPIIRLIRALEMRVYRACDAICVITPRFVQILGPRVPKRVLMEVIPNFVNTDLYKPLPRESEYSASRGLTDRFVVSYVGNIGDAQDFSPVLAAAKRCEDLPVTFLMVGNGIRKEGLETEAENQGLSNIEFWDYQPRETTPLINAASDVCLVLLDQRVNDFVFPSKLYTIMASARPAIFVGDAQSDTAALINDTKCGWVVPCGENDRFADLVEHLYHDRQNLVTYGENGRQSAEQDYTAQRVGQMYHDLIERLVGGTR